MNMYEDDWDRNRCSHGHLGHDDDDDRPIFAPIHDLDDGYEERTRPQQQQQPQRRKEMECNTSPGNPGKVEMRLCQMTDANRNVFIMASKALSILTEAYAGLSDEDRQTVNRIITKGMGNVDPNGEHFIAAIGRTKAALACIIRELSGGHEVPVFDIWMEGSDDEDGKFPAKLLASGIPGSDFPDAVDYWHRSTVDADIIYGPLVSKGQGAWRKMWIYGSRLFDNETDARRSFG